MTIFVLKYGSELDEAQQVGQIKAMENMIRAGPTLEGKFIMSVLRNWEVSQNVLLGAIHTENAIVLKSGITNRF